MKYWMGALVATFFVAGCLTPTPCWMSTPQMCGLRESCRTVDDCLSRVCAGGLCAQCTGSDQCAANEACLAGTCSTMCTPADRLDGRRVCEGGRVTTCASAANPEGYCATCECPGGSRCSSFDCSAGDCSCIPLAAVGAACASDFECASENCSSFDGVCRVARGATCTVDNCDECLRFADGTSYCSGACTSGTSCGDGFCSGAYADIPYRHCYPSCTGRSCDCRTVSGGTTTYCACGGSAAGCERLEARHDALEPCGSFDSEAPDCAVGSCVGRRVCGVGCYSWGYCGDTCTTDAQCGADGVCGRLPCVGSSCPAVCMPRCPAGGRCAGEGTCQSVPGVASGEVMACTTKLPTGSACATGEDCISATCTSRRCL
jgi:hypothetical protein